MNEFRFLPPAASTLAGDVDTLYLFFLVVCGSAAMLVFVLVPLFAWRFRRRSEKQVPNPPKKSIRLEILSSALPLLIVLVLFVWGARIYINAYIPPPEALEIFVTGKQWMWKIQHPEGKREINALHVPVGEPIKLTMTSEDVVHSFFIPAFRVKRDVIPGRYSDLWFEATTPGEYHLFCAEYCGSEHSRMVGTVTVMTPHAYNQWLSDGQEGTSMVEAGLRLFEKHGCASCHSETATARGPDLRGLYKRKVLLATGETVVADEGYLRESILYPNAKIVAGHTIVMPTFKGQIGEEGVSQLISFIKSLGADQNSPETQAADGTP
ncbi:MAG: cytochrome c oxidase subunit II [Myxococcota bacterium]